MEIIHKEYTFPSKTGVCTIYARSWRPKDVEIKGVLQIHHGMAEHTERYIDFAKFMCQKGYAVITHDMANHGKSNQNLDELGYFGEKDGWINLVEDMKTVTEIAKKEFPNKPVFLLGHSMGSFVTRCYIAKYASGISGAVISGTSGKNPLAGTLGLLSGMIGKLKGKKHHSALLDSAAFGSYNKTFDGRTNKDWLSRNEKNVDEYINDPKCGFVFTAQGFNDLGNLLVSANSQKWYDAVPKDLPICLLSGEKDPVGNYGKGVEEVYKKLLDSGHKVYRKLYANARHEILNEINSKDVHIDIANFLDNALEGKLDEVSAK